MARKSKKSEVAVIETPIAVIETNPGEYSTTEGIEDAEIVAPLLNEVIADEIEAEAIAEIATLEAEQTDIVSVEDVADVVSILEAEDSATVVEDAVYEAPAEAIVDGETDVSFDKIVEGISAEEKLHAVKAMANAVDERMAFELTNGNDNIQKTLKKAREAFTLPSAGAVLLACGVDEGFVNRSMHDGKRYNVYAMGKLADAIKALNGGRITNAINNAVMRSLFAARRAGVPFTGEVAKMAASDKIRVQDAAIKAILIRHTVAASTAPTQASSTMQAMETLGLVTRSGHKNPVYTLTDHPAVAKLEEALNRAA